ncbi:MAG: dephospho-CoA kinase [Prevotellaceae bacterium]|jgi:dephospho-CoA kinase|nr:dephospho-CoA kinase [Prevotellaceae bacterium]
MLTLCLTGGIGSGKSYVSHIFAALGIGVYEADSQTKGLYDRDMVLKSGIIKLLGEEVCCNGVWNREVMANKIFTDKALLQRVNDLVHPAVQQDFLLWKSQQKSSYTILESAIILETPFASLADKIVTVSAPLEVRLARLQHRDPESAKDAQRRIERQWSDAQRESMSHFVIRSDGKTPLLPQVLTVHRLMIDQLSNY